MHYDLLKVSFFPNRKDFLYELQKNILFNVGLIAGRPWATVWLGQSD